MELSITSAAGVLAIGTANRCVDRAGGRGNAIAVAQAARLSRAHRSTRVCITQQRRLSSAKRVCTPSPARVLATSAAGRGVDHKVDHGEG